MSWWLKEDFSEEHARQLIREEERVLLMVLHYCWHCDSLLMNIPPMAEYQSLTMPELDTYLKFKTFRVNAQGNLVVHRKDGTLCEKCKTT